MIRIRCLGQLSVIRDGSQLPPGAIQPRRMGLLALLAAAGERAQGRERLTGLLWPDSDEERARGSLAQALYSLRKDLGSEDAIQGVRELRLNPEFVETDLWDFETHRSSGSLARAVEEYTGPFLEGFHLPGLAEFDRWREEERAAWAGRHLEVVERLAALAEQGDDRVAAVKWWRRAASQEPHNARLIIRLMRAMARGGDRAGAIRQSEIYAAMLERELELAPDPAVLKEAEAIRKGGQGAGEPASQRTAAPPTIPAPAAGSAPEPVPMPLPVPVALPPRRRRTAPVLAGLLVVAAGVVTFALTRNRPESLEERRVLVAPLSNETGDSTLSLVGPMVAEWVTRGLSETGLVEVMDSRTVLEATRDAGRCGT
jgi:DNA-binding SARP family transcriptional activator